jgi:hypothetical protein
VSNSILDALRLLEAKRIETVLDMLAAGQTPPTKRFLLGATQARQRVRRAGFADRIEPLWESDPDALSTSAG